MVLQTQVVSKADQVVRLACMSVVAVALVASAVAIGGWQAHATALGAIIATITVVLIRRGYRSADYLHRRSVDVSEASRRCEQHYLDVLRQIITVVEARDKYTQGRSERIGRLCERMTRKLSLPSEKCELMYLAGQLHDIGLLAVPESILNKPTVLTTSDSNVVRQHSDVSCDVLQPLTMLADALPAIRHHHERMNGTGYPGGISSDGIPMEARILAVADAYDAMTHDRPYRSAMTSRQAMSELRRCCPNGFDSTCVEALGDVVNMPKLEVATAAS